MISGSLIIIGEGFGLVLVKVDGVFVLLTSTRINLNTTDDSGAEALLENLWLHGARLLRGGGQTVFVGADRSSQKCIKVGSDDS